MKTNLILQKVSFLHGLIDPNWVDGNPGQPGPIFRRAIADYAVAEILRDISLNLQDRDLGKQVHNIGNELVTSASQRLVAGWEDGDSLCPPYKHPFPRFVGEEITALLTNPASGESLEHVAPAMNDMVLAHALRQMASFTANEKSSHAIRQVGETIVKSASSKLFDEYCGTPVKPHAPAPRPKVTAA
jgi:hypothetical protein